MKQQAPRLRWFECQELLGATCQQLWATMESEGNPDKELCLDVPLGLLGSKVIRSVGYVSGQIITTSAEVTPNGGLVRASPQNPLNYLNSGFEIIVICPDVSLIYPIYK